MPTRTHQSTFLTINAPATTLSTVNEILTQALKIKEFEGNCMCVFDQALHGKVADIAWKPLATFNRLFFEWASSTAFATFWELLEYGFLMSGCAIQRLNLNHRGRLC